MVEKATESAATTSRNHDRRRVRIDQKEGELRWTGGAIETVSAVPIELDAPQVDIGGNAFKLLNAGSAVREKKSTKEENTQHTPDTKQ